MAPQFFLLTLLQANLSAHAAAPVDGGGNCGLTLSATSVSLVWSTTLPTQQINFTVTKAKNPGCNYSVSFSKGTNNPSDYDRRMSSGTDHLNYQLYKESSLTNILKEAPDATTANDVLSGSFGTGKNQSQTQTYFIQIPFNLATQPKLKPPGNYADTYLLKLFNGTSSTPEDTANVTLATQILRDVQLSLVPTGSDWVANSTAQTLNFGTLTPGTSRTFDMRVLSNAGYRVTFSSQNGGVLKHATATTATAQTTVAYTLSVNGTPQTLSSGPVDVAMASGQTTTSGIASPITVTIGSVTDKLAGSYSDNITVTAATTE
jgi:hypothetical protein